jgi:hypothetical protein
MATFSVENKVSLQEGLSAYQIQDGVLKELANRGIPIPPVPTYMTETGPSYYQGDIPPDLTELSDKQLGKLLGLLSIWIDYLSTQIELAKMSKNVAKEQLDLTASIVRLTYKEDEEGKRRIADERNDLVKRDPRFVEANRIHLHLDSYYELMKVRLSSAHQNYKAVSRRISQVLSDNDRAGRDASVQQFSSPAVIAPTRARRL